MKRPHPRRSIKELTSSTMMRWPSLPYMTLPIVIIVLTLIVSLIGYSLANLSLEGSRERSTNRNLRENMIRINGVFDAYAHLLWGSTGRLQAADASREGWSRFINVFNIRENFTGLEALGVTSGNDPASQEIMYVTPETEATRPTIGINLNALPGIVSTTEKAARTAKTVVSGAVPELFSTKEGVTDAHAGFLMLTPYYDTSLPQATPDERVQALRGYSIALFRGDIFFERIFRQIDLSHTKIAVYLGDEASQNLLYTGGKNTDTDTRTARQQINYYGKTFTIVYTFDTAHLLVWSLTYFPQILFVAALLVGMIFAGVAGYLLRSRYRRLTYEKERDVNFAKDELLSLASHQLRTPATGVKQYLGMVLQGFAGDVPDKQRTYLERAYASNNRQLHVINDILHIAKLETGRIVLTERKFDIAKMVRDVIDEQRDQAERGGVQLKLTVPSQGWIVADSHMLWMVVENLVSNAIKYTPADGVVSVRLARRGNRWVLTVKDTGVGIAKSDFSKLFKQFSRITNARSDFVTGTGVGLYLAHHLTVLHGGTIGVTSTKGKGSTFTVRLPRKT